MSENVEKLGLPIPTKLVEFILLGPLDDRRQLQDSPILGDVWVDFGKQPRNSLDLLIAPYRGQHAGEVATAIGQGLGLFEDDDEGHVTAAPDGDSTDTVAEQDVKKALEINIAFLQGLIVARLTFKEMMRVVVPKTRWWLDKWKENEDSELEHDITKMTPSTQLKLLHTVLDSASAHFRPSEEALEHETRRLQELPSLDRFWALTGLILWAGEQPVSIEISPAGQISHILDNADVLDIAARLDELAAVMLKHQSTESLKRKSKPEPLVYQVSRNRPPMPALTKSIAAVKADAATYLFKVNCSGVGWAVIDSGIAGNHPAFLNEEGKSRVKRSFDFKNFRRIVNLSNSKTVIRDRNIAQLMNDNKSLLRPLQVGEENEDKKRLEEVHNDLKRMAEDARKRSPVRWELVEKYVEINPSTPPPTSHGTHVAGIIGASKKNAQAAANQAAEQAAKEKSEREEEKAAQRRLLDASGTGIENPAANLTANPVESDVEKKNCKENPDFADGMCPDISLYDFRVLGHSIEDGEFAIIAALQFIRYLNDRDNFLTIHGANLSLSIPHDVRNFACGRTPICDECERLVSNGVVVVAAAGNHGYKSFETNEGSYDSYAAFSITDPGNADNVLTVGSTHRFWPHTYGVSFFSSRGPTGDGRQKPDLVAPGERIRAPIGGRSTSWGEWGDLDGTSMAAPHVSGAAAMLMARYSELVGQPLRIKRILCESATDLGRERSFQGHGMLDVLRAFQSI